MIKQINEIFKKDDIELENKRKIAKKRAEEVLDMKKEASKEVKKIMKAIDSMKKDCIEIELNQVKSKCTNSNLKKSKF
jgi:hypothetical protein